MVREGLSFVSHLPIAMDGSCNGLQLFSLMLRDPVGGTAVNLLPADTPQDIYRLVADKIIAKLERDRTGGEERLDQEVRTKRTGQALYKPRSVAGLFLSLGIDRSATKRQVMVLPYYGTRESCREYTAQWLKEKLFASPQPLPPVRSGRLSGRTHLGSHRGNGGGRPRRYGVSAKLRHGHEPRR